jgi:hypothetical protein
MGTYVHHPWTKANLNKLIGMIEGAGGGGGGGEKNE